MNLQKLLIVGFACTIGVPGTALAAPAQSAPAKRAAPKTKAPAKRAAPKLKVPTKRTVTKAQPAKKPAARTTSAKKVKPKPRVIVPWMGRALMAPRRAAPRRAPVRSAAPTARVVAPRTVVVKPPTARRPQAPVVAKGAKARPAPTSRPVARRPAVRPSPRAVASRAPAKRVVARRSAPTSRPVLARKPPARRSPVWRPLPKRYPPVDAKAVMYLQSGTNTTQLGAIGHTNWFGLRVQESGWYVLQTKGKSDPHCTLYRKDFRYLSRDDDSGERRNCRIIRKLEPGTYLFEVMLLPHRRTQYQLSFTPLQEKSLALGQGEKNRLTWPGDVHLYRFKIKQAGLYQLTTTGRADTVCQLFQPGKRAATIMARDDDSGTKRNCALSWHFQPGTYTAMVTGSYVGKGPYKITLKKGTTPGLKFKVLSFGKLHKDIISGPHQAHRFRFSLKKPARLTFLAQFRRSTPQMLLRTTSGAIVAPEGSISKLRGRYWLRSQWLQAGEYDLELRATGNPRGAYILLGHIESDILLAANKARPVANGVPQTPTKAPFQHALFRVALDGRYYSILESDQPKILGCFLETLDGQQVAVDLIPSRKPRPCRIPSTKRSGVFLFRVLFLKSKFLRKRSKRLSYFERKRLRRKRLREMMRRYRNLRKRRLHKHRYNRNFRRLYKAPPRTAPRRRPPPRRAAPPPKMMLLPLLNRWQGPQVRLIQTSPVPLAMNSSTVTKSAGVLTYQIDVPKADLYWFSTRGASVSGCKLENLATRAIRQSPLTRRGCDVAVYLQRGSFLFRVHAEKPGRRTLSWRKFRSAPKTLGQEPVVVGPVKQGQRQVYQLRVRRTGFYRLSAKVASSVPLKTKSLLKQGTRIVARPQSSSRPSEITSYLKKGTYQLHVRVYQGRGAYMLQQRMMPFHTLLQAKAFKSRLKGYNDAHFFLLKIKRSGTYEFRTEGKLDTVCTLYNSTNRKVSRNDDSGTKRNCKITKYLRAGQYSIKVRNLTRKAGKFSAQYKTVKVSRRLARRMRLLRRLRAIRARRRRATGRWARFRNSPGRTIRKVIRLGRAYTSVLRNKRDRNLFLFRVTRPGRYLLETKGPAARTDTKCYLYKGTRLIGSNDDSGYRLHCKLRATLRPGLYRLRVVLALSTRAGPYKIAVRRAGTPWPGGVAVARRRRLRKRRRRIHGLARRGTARRGTASSRRRARRLRGRHWLGNMRRGAAARRARRTTPKAQPATGAQPAKGITLRPGLRSQAMSVRHDRTDLYTVKIPTAGTYEIETDGSLDTKCYLDDARGGVVAVNDDGGDAANCRIRLRLPYGTYQLRVSIRTAGRIGPYGVSLRIRRR